jgi:hypothetical protein
MPEETEFVPDLFPCWTVTVTDGGSKATYIADGYDQEAAQLRAWIAANAESGPGLSVTTVSEGADVFPRPGEPNEPIDLRGCDWHKGHILPAASPVLDAVDLVLADEVAQVGVQVYRVQVNQPQKPTGANGSVLHPLTAEFCGATDEWGVWESSRKHRTALNAVIFDRVPADMVRAIAAHRGGLDIGEYNEQMRPFLERITKE